MASPMASPVASPAASPTASPVASPVASPPLTAQADGASPDDPRASSVTFRMFASARAAAGAAEVQVAPGPTAEVVAGLAADLPTRFAEVMAASSLVADGFRLDRSSSAPIAAGTIVDVLPPFAGG
jgi:sulfur-carrier protein